MSDALTEEQISEHEGIHRVFGPVFLGHVLSEQTSDRKNIMKLLIEWLTDEAEELPDGYVVIRTSDVPFNKLDVVRQAFAVCTHVFKDREVL